VQREARHVDDDERIGGSERSGGGKGASSMGKPGVELVIPTAVRGYGLFWGVLSIS
jgi:hypothetical protein